MARGPKTTKQYTRLYAVRVDEHLGERIEDIVASFPGATVSEGIRRFLELPEVASLVSRRSSSHRAREALRAIAGPD